eukprot:2425332-Prymnesium_polylepis.1
MPFPLAGNGVRWPPPTSVSGSYAVSVKPLGSRACIGLLSLCLSDSVSWRAARAVWFVLRSSLVRVCVLTGYEDAVHELGTRARRAGAYATR